MNFASEFKKAMLPGSKWMRVNHVNPRASTPTEVTVIKTTPQEVIFQAGDSTPQLTWPHKLGMTVTLDQSGWTISDPSGRKILTYSPVNGQSVVGAAESLVNALLQDAEEEGWIGVDFDGTLAKHTDYKGATKLGEPVPKMVARVRRWVGHGKRVKIFTARADDERSVNAIKKWLKTHELPDLEITNLKDKGMIEFWDDKAVAVKRNTGEVKEDATAIVQFLLAESPEIKTLKKNARPLDPAERAQVMKAGAVWHHGPNGEPTPAVRKAVVNGTTWYWCATHRFGQVRSTLAAAIKTFPAVEETS